MIKYMEGNIFDSTADILVNPVNCRGVMGGGLALEFKKRYPEMYRWHLVAIVFGSLKIGRPWLWHNIYGIQDVLCFPTKDHWKDPSKLEYIVDGLEWCWHFIKPRQTIAFPKLGCGLGGLDWDDVQPVMKKYLSTMYMVEVEVWI